MLGVKCCNTVAVFVSFRLISASFVEGLGKLELVSLFCLFSEGLESLGLTRLLCKKNFPFNDFTQKTLSQGNLEPDMRLPVWQNTRSQIT